MVIFHSYGAVYQRVGEKGKHIGKKHMETTKLNPMVNLVNHH